MKTGYYLIFVATLFIACKDDPIVLMPVAGTLAGGMTTIYSSGPDAYTFPLANLDAPGLQKHFLADGAFAQHFVTAPAQQFGGVGPLFNQNSCESCHVRNGRGTPPLTGGDPNTGLLLRLSLPGVLPNGDVVPVPGFGGQLQTKAIFGGVAEGSFSLTWQQELHDFLDGSQVSTSQPEYRVVSTYSVLPEATLVSPRNAPPVHGLGLLEAIPESAILALEDVNDVDGDGISGKANLVWDIAKQGTSLGRFGWKAGQPTAAQQSAGAAHDDIGLTNTYFPEESCDGQSNCNTGLSDSLDVNDELLGLFTFYIQTIGVPAARNLDKPEVIQGNAIFQEAKCASCHHPKFVTGAHPIPALANQEIFPYTDLLLHDMGEGLADHRPEFLADGTEWRTPPLWGIGLTQVVNHRAGFLHDGRAMTLEEAILWHGGEAESSREYYKALSKEERDQLLSFLQSL